MARLPVSALGLLAAILSISPAAAADGGSVFDFPITARNGYQSIALPLGTPPVTYNLLFDTGSTTTWLIDAGCSPLGCPNNSGFPRNTYNVSASSTGHVDKDIWSSIEYSGGYVSGFAASDVLTLVNAAGANVAFTQSFADVTYSTWNNLGADGLLGLASTSIAFPNTTSMVESMILQGLLKESVVGMYHGVDTDSTSNGVLTLGGSKAETYAREPVRWVDVNTPFDVYKTPLKSISGISSAGAPPGSVSWTGDVVFDTGAGISAVPSSHISEVYALTPFNYTAISTGYRPLCTEFNDTWSLSLTFGQPGAEETFTLSGAELAKPGYVDAEHCWPPFNPWESAGNVLLGGNWLRRWYGVFDLGDGKGGGVKVGFAGLKEEYMPGAKGYSG